MTSPAAMGSGLGRKQVVVGYRHRPLQQITYHVHAGLAGGPQPVELTTAMVSTMTVAAVTALVRVAHVGFRLPLWTLVHLPDVASVVPGQLRMVVRVPLPNIVSAVRVRLVIGFVEVVVVLVVVVVAAAAVVVTVVVMVVPVDHPAQRACASVCVADLAVPWLQPSQAAREVLGGLCRGVVAPLLWTVLLGVLVRVLAVIALWTTRRDLPQARLPVPLGPGQLWQRVALGAGITHLQEYRRDIPQRLPVPTC